MDNRDWSLSDHGVCVSARKYARYADDVAARLDDAREDYANGDEDVARVILEEISRELRLLANGARVIVAAFDRGR